MLSWTMMSMSCALRNPAVMKPSVATCHPWLQDSQLPSSFTWLWHRRCCRRFARSLSLRLRRLQLSTFFIRTDSLLTSTLTAAHLLSLPSSSEPEKNKHSSTRSLWNNFRISLSTTTPRKAAPLSSVISILTTMCPPTPTPPS